MLDYNGPVKTGIWVNVANAWDVAHEDDRVADIRVITESRHDSKKLDEQLVMMKQTGARFSRELKWVDDEFPCDRCQSGDPLMSHTCCVVLPICNKCMTSNAPFIGFEGMTKEEANGRWLLCGSMKDGPILVDKCTHTPV